MTTTIIILLAIAGVIWFFVSRNAKETREREEAQRREKEAIFHQKRVEEVAAQSRSYQMSPSERAAEARRRGY